MKRAEFLFLLKYTHRKGYHLQLKVSFSGLKVRSSLTMDTVDGWLLMEGFQLDSWALLKSNLKFWSSGFQVQTVSDLLKALRIGREKFATEKTPQRTLSPRMPCRAAHY